MKFFDLTEHRPDPKPDSRKIIINRQVQSIMDAINPNNDDSALLTEKLTEMRSHKPGLKPESLIIAIENLDLNDDSTNHQAVKNLLINILDKIKVGYVKERLIKQVESNNDLDPLHEHKFYEKLDKPEKGQLISKEIDPEDPCQYAEIFSEYIASQLAYTIFLPNLSPKVRLYGINKIRPLESYESSSEDSMNYKEGSTSEEDDDQEYILTSKIIKDFKQIRDFNYEQMKQAKNFGAFFAANCLLGDYDLHSDNVGLIGDELARIDFGKAFSYHYDQPWVGSDKFTTEPKSAEKFLQRMKEVKIYINGHMTQMYPDSMF
jgi:hypothetical protein